MYLDTPAVEEESSRPCIECEVSRELLLHKDQLMPPLYIRSEWFEESEQKKWGG